MQNKISHMEEKCHHEKLKQQIIKCLNCFPNSKIVQPSLHFLCQYLEAYFVRATDIYTW